MELYCWYEVSHVIFALDALLSNQHIIPILTSFQEHVDLVEKIRETHTAIAHANTMRIKLHSNQYPTSALHRKITSNIALKYQLPDHKVPSLPSHSLSSSNLLMSSQHTETVKHISTISHQNLDLQLSESET
jgi:hypothetical protein